MNAQTFSRRALKSFLTIMSLVSVATGLHGMIYPGISNAMHESVANGALVVLDSNYRYYSGIWIGVGVVMLGIIPTIERQRATLGSLSLLIFLGGIGRLVSILLFAIPESQFLFFTALELLFPLILVWQSSIAVPRSV